MRTGLAGGGAEYLVTSALSYAPPWLAVYRHHVLLACDRGGVRHSRRSFVSTREASHDDLELLAGLEDLTPATVERRRGLATAVYQALFDRFTDTGRTTAYVSVQALNDPSLFAHPRWGFIRVGRARMVSLPGLQLAFCSTWPVRSRSLHRTATWRPPPYRPA